MATELINPSGDITDEWSGGDPFGWQEVDEGIGAPDTGTDLTTSGVSVQTEILTLANPVGMDGDDHCTSIRVGFHGKRSAGGIPGVMTVTLVDMANNDITGGGSKTINFTTSASTIYTAAWTVDLSHAEIVACRIKFTNPANTYQYWVYTVSVEVTYEALPVMAVTEINIGDDWKQVTQVLINVGDVWKDANDSEINIGDVWKDVAS